MTATILRYTTRFPWWSSSMSPLMVWILVLWPLLLQLNDYEDLASSSDGKGDDNYDD
jgi:hypothetical protein